MRMRARRKLGHWLIFSSHADRTIPQVRNPKTISFQRTTDLSLIIYNNFIIHLPNAGGMHALILISSKSPTFSGQSRLPLYDSHLWKVLLNNTQLQRIRVRPSRTSPLQQCGEAGIKSWGILAPARAHQLQGRVKRVATSTIKHSHYLQNRLHRGFQPEVNTDQLLSRFVMHWTDT